MKKIILFILLFNSIFICCSNSRKQIEDLIKKGDATSLIEASYIIGEKHDTTFISFLLTNCTDERVSHNKNFLGVSVYQSKMIALKKISGLSYLPQGNINYLPDSAIINYYKAWASVKGYRYN